MQGWLKCTQAKVPFYFGELLLQSQDKGVREALVELFLVLFKRGSEAQRLLLVNILAGAVSRITHLGFASKELLDLCFKFLQAESGEASIRPVLDALFHQAQAATQIYLRNPSLGFFSFLQDHIAGQRDLLVQAFDMKGCSLCVRTTPPRQNTLHLEEEKEFRLVNNRLSYKFNRLVSIEQVKVSNKTKSHVKQVVLKSLSQGVATVIGSQPCDSVFNTSFSTREIQVELVLERVRASTTCPNCKVEFQGLACSSCGKGLEVHVTTAEVKEQDVTEVMKDVKALCLELQAQREKAVAIYNVFTLRQGKIVEELGIPTKAVTSAYTELMSILAALGGQQGGPGLPPGYSQKETHCASCNSLFLRELIGKLREHCPRVGQLCRDQLQQFREKVLERLMWGDKVSESIRGLVMECYLTIAGVLWDSKDYLRTKVAESFSAQQQRLSDGREFIRDSMLALIEGDKFRGRALFRLDRGKDHSFSRQLQLYATPGPRLPLEDYSELPQWVLSHANEASILEFLGWALPIRRFWNCWIYDSVAWVEKLLEEWEPERILELAIRGCRAGLESFFLKKCLEVVTPQRRVLTLRLDPPERELKEHQRVHKEKLQHPYLSTKEVSSKEVGWRMKDLHDYICRQLNGSFTFDLVVDNRLVDNLEVPIEEVYKKFAREEKKPSDYVNICKELFQNKDSLFYLRGVSSANSLRVIYRLRGLFGEASEEMIGPLPDEQEDRCMRLALHFTNDSGEGQSIAEGLLQVVESKDTQVVATLLRLLCRICRQREVVQALARRSSSIDCLVDAVLQFVRLEMYDLVEEFSPVFTKLIAEVDAKQIRRKMSHMEVEEQRNDRIVEKTQRLLRLVQELAPLGRPGLVGCIERLVPFCTKNDSAATRLLVEHLRLGQEHDGKQLGHLVEMLSHTPEHYDSLKLFTLESGIFERAVSELRGGLRVECSRTLLMLSLVSGAVRGCFRLQSLLLNSGLLPQVFQLGKGKRQFQLVRLAQELIEYLGSGALVAEEVREFSRNLVQLHESRLKKINGLKRQGTKHLLKERAKSYLHSSSLQEEALHCVICGEGYRHSSLVLGVYLFSERREDCGEEGRTGISSVSWFNLIHLDCHTRSLPDHKNKKAEWEFAARSNENHECNNWMPIRHSLLAREDYDTALKKYKECSDALASCRLLPLQVMFADLQSLLLRLAVPEAFRDKPPFEHNCRLALVLAHNLRVWDGLPKFDPSEPALVLLAKPQVFHKHSHSIASVSHGLQLTRVQSILLALLLRKVPGKQLEDQLGGVLQLSNSWRQKSALEPEAHLRLIEDECR